MNDRNRIQSRRRLEAVAAVMAVGLLLLGLRAVDLHWIQADELRAVAEKQRYRQFTTTPPRGPILDVKGRTLAESIEVPSIAAMAREVPEDRIAALAEALEADAPSLRRRLTERNGFVWLARQITPERAERVMALGIPGIRRETEWRRYHPLGPETGHLLGFVGVDGRGLEGLERSLDERLAGTPGVRQVRRDARGRSLPGGIWLRRPKGGESIRLHIDAFMQSIAYAALAEGVRRYEAKGGAAVIMRPEDGAMLAVANWPGFNPNDFRRFRPDEWRNRAITDIFEPGSSLKPFTVAAALETETWRRESRIYCEDGHFSVADHTIHDAHAEGWLDMTGLLARSSNIGAAKVALDIGPERLRGMLDRVGLTHRTGIPLGGESPGIVPPLQRWGPVETANIAFGQGIAVTPLQLATAFCVLANDGLRVAPRLVVGDSGGAPAPKRVMSADVARQVRTMLIRATGPEGTGRRAVPRGYTIAGKTGTAQKPDGEGGYSEDRFTAVFAGMAPADDPRVVIAVVIDEPREKIYGGQVAAPVFRTIAAATLPYLGITPRRQDEPDFAPMPAAAPVTETAAPGIVPQLRGRSLRETRRIIARLGYDLRARGSGWVVHQEPAAFAELPPGGTVEVRLDD